MQQQQSLQSRIENYVKPRLAKTLLRSNDASRRNQSRSISQAEYQMDELSKKILRGIKGFFRNDFKKQLRGKPDRSRISEYQKLLSKYFSINLNCTLSLDDLITVNRDEYKAIIWIFFPLPIQRIISQQKGFKIEKPQIFGEGYKGKLNNFFTSESKIGILIFGQFFSLWSFFIENCNLQEAKKSKYEVYLRDIRNQLHVVTQQQQVWAYGNYQEQEKEQEYEAIDQQSTKIAGSSLEFNYQRIHIEREYPERGYQERVVIERPWYGGNTYCSPSNSLEDSLFFSNMQHYDDDNYLYQDQMD